MRSVIRGAVLAMGVAALVLSPVRAQRAAPPEAQKIGDDLYRVGKMRVDLKAQTATCIGKFNMQKGLIEYVAVGYGGKRHESLLTLDVRPLHFQVALILLGLEPGGGLKYQGDPATPKGPPVEVLLTWPRKGKPVTMPASDLVWDVTKKATLQRKAWVFSGSAVDKRGFVADVEQSLIATFHDHEAIVNNVLPSGADDTVLKVNERVAPPLGTPVTVTLSPLPTVAVRPLPPMRG